MVVDKIDIAVSIASECFRESRKPREVSLLSRINNP
jgi:hypothetical protein